MKVWIVAWMMLWAGSAGAATVAVAPVDYRDAGTQEAVAEAAAAVEKKVVDGVAAAGHTVVEGDAVKAAVDGQSVDGACDGECLRRVAEELGADEIVFVSVVDAEQVSYEVALRFAGREAVTDTRTDGFYVVLEWLKGQVALALKDVVVREEEPEGPVADEGAAEETTGAAVVAAPERTPEDGARKKLSKTPFVVALAATAALGVTTLVLDRVAHRKFTTMEDQIELDPLDDIPGLYDEVDAEIESIERLQTAEKVFLGLTIAGAVTTGILAVFTDFHGKKAAKPESVAAWRPQVGVDSRGGVLGIAGSF